jgi:hypothetical protein
MFGRNIDVLIKWKKVVKLSQQFVFWWKQCKPVIREDSCF